MKCALPGFLFSTANPLREKTDLLTCLRTTPYPSDLPILQNAQAHVLSYRN